MRIIGGELKGRRLPSPTWSGLRPTSDRLRETLFNILAGDVAGALVLDGCAGTGALGLEALSRGAAGVTFIDCDARAVALIEANLDRCGAAARGKVVRGALPDALDRLDAAIAFDLVLLDPPYEYDDRAVGAILSAAGPAHGGRRPGGGGTGTARGKGGRATVAAHAAGEGRRQRPRFPCQSQGVGWPSIRGRSTR